MFHQCQSAIQRMAKQSRGASKQEQRILKNVISSLAVSLQDLSTNFRKSQSSYLKSEYITISFFHVLHKL
jgi:syntaxin 16